MKLVLREYYSTILYNDINNPLKFGEIVTKIEGNIQEYNYVSSSSKKISMWKDVIESHNDKVQKDYLKYLKITKEPFCKAITIYQVDYSMEVITSYIQDVNNNVIKIYTEYEN